MIRPGEMWGPGQIMDDGCGGAEVCLDAIKPHYDSAVAAGKAVGLGLGLKNSGLGNGFREVCGAVVRFRGRRTSSRSATAGPRWARACTRSRCRSRRRSSASTRTAST